MRTIELTENQYKEFLELKNYISMRTRQMTNPIVLAKEGKLKNLSLGSVTALRSCDYEPEYSFGECLSDVIGSIWDEQQRGEVNYIT